MSTLLESNGHAVDGARRETFLIMLIVPSNSCWSMRMPSFMSLVKCHRPSQHSPDALICSNASRNHCRTFSVL
eukprot:9197030-Alexandrium_andersonii.AAC.1